MEIEGQEGGQSNFGETTSMLNALEGVGGMSEETRQGIVDMQTKRETGAPMETGDNPTSTETPAVETPAVETPANTEGGEDTPPAVETPEGEGGTPPVAEGGETLEEAFKVDSPLFGGEKEIGKANEPAGSEEQKFENLDSLNTYLKDQHSIDDVNALAGKIETWKQQEESIDKLTSEAGNVKSLFEGMHPDLYAAVNADAKGEDWRTVVNSNVLDYMKTATDFKDQELVDKLSPGTLTAEDWEEFNDEDGDASVKRLVSTTIENAKAKFESNKAQFDKARLDSVATAQANQDAFNGSLAKAKESMIGVYKDADTNYVDSLESIFTEKGIASVFYNEDGTLKEDAFERMAMAKDGAALITQYQQIAERKVETKTNQEILSRGADTPGVSKGSNANQGKEELRPEVKDALSAIKGLGGTRTY